MSELYNADGPGREDDNSLRATHANRSGGDLNPPDLTSGAALPGITSERGCARQIAPDVFDKLISESRVLMTLSSETFDDLPVDLTDILGKRSIDPEAPDEASYNPSKEDITNIATELCRDRIRVLLSDPAFDSQFGETWRRPLSLKSGSPVDEELVEILALGLRTLISIIPEKGKTPENSRTFEYDWPTTRFEPTLGKHVSEATHIGPESWHMGRFLFGEDLMRETVFFLALHESCENASHLKPHRFRERRDKGQLSLVRTAENLEARQKLQMELVRNFGLNGLGTAIAAEALSEKIPINGSLEDLKKGKEYQEFIQFSQALIEAHKDDFPDFARLPKDAMDRAFGIGAIEFGRFYRQIRSANRQVLRAINPNSGHSILVLKNSREFLLNTAQGIIQAVTIDKANNARSVGRYLGDSYLRERVNDDLSLARASIVAQSGRILLAAQTIRDCIKMYPETIRAPLIKACDLLVDLLYTAVEVDVNPTLRAGGLPAITANETYSAYRKISKPLQNKVEELYGDGVDRRICDVLDKALSGDLYITCILNMRGNPNKGDMGLRDRPIH